jgi:hypothetical protein
MLRLLGEIAGCASIFLLLGIGLWAAEIFGVPV